MTDQPCACVAERAIRAVLNRYSLALDGRDLPALTRVFAEDAVADYGGGPLVGREAIVRMIGRGLSLYEGTAHCLTNVDIELVDSIRAQTTTYVLAWHWRIDTKDSGPDRAADFCLAAKYVDVLAQEDDGGWLIVDRKLVRLGTEAGIATGSRPSSLVQFTLTGST